jgi:hypothetical protein
VFVSWLFAFLGFLAVKPEPAKVCFTLPIFLTSTTTLLHCHILLSLLLIL